MVIYHHYNKMSLSNWIIMVRLAGLDKEIIIYMRMKKKINIKLMGIKGIKLIMVI